MKMRDQSHSDYNLQPQLAFYHQGNHATVMFMSNIFYNQQWTVHNFCLFLLSSSPFSFSNHHSDFFGHFPQKPFIKNQIT